MNKLRVGFLIDRLKVDYHVEQLIKFVEKDKSFEKPVLITGYANDKHQSFSQKLVNLFKGPPLKVIDKIFKALLFRLIRKIELFQILGVSPNYDRNIDLGNNSSFEIVSVKGQWSKSGLFIDFTYEDVSHIINSELDCIIRCGSGILRGKILDSSKYGVLSFHHGDNRINRGGPSGFWEVLNGDPSTGFIIQKLNSELDGGEVFFRGNITTADYWTLNNATLLEKSNIFMKRTLKELATKKKLPIAEDIRLHGNKLYKINSSKILLKYCIKILIPKIFFKMISKILSPKVDRWSVAYALHNNFSKSLWRYKEIKNPIGRFLADPFVFQKDAADYIFVEDFFYSDGKGRISAIKISDESYKFLGVVLEEDFHLSFPFIFTHEDQVYMIPESSENKDIRLYKCEKFPSKWTLEKILMSDVSAADTMIFFKNNIWFMLTNIDSANCGDHNSELHVFYTTNFNSNSWKPINPTNPIIFDSLRSRNGGMFSHKGVTYRVNQIQAKGRYGKSFAINKIHEISENEFIEEKISEVSANFKDGIVATHGFSANEKVAAVDYAREQRLVWAKRT